MSDQQQEFRVRVVTSTAHEGTVKALCAAQAAIIARDLVRRGVQGEDWHSISLGVSGVDAVLASELPW